MLRIMGEGRLTDSFKTKMVPKAVAKLTANLNSPLCEALYCLTLVFEAAFTEVFRHIIFFGTKTFGSTVVQKLWMMPW